MYEGKEEKRERTEGTCELFIYGEDAILESRAVTDSSRLVVHPLVQFSLEFER